MNRKLPEDKCALLVLLGNPKTNEEYELALLKHETHVENKIIEVLKKIGIHSIVKTDKYSLPVQYEIIKKNRGGSYLNDAFDTTEFTRKIVKQLLSDDIRKVRFYVDTDIVGGNFGFGSLIYKFKYYAHK